MADYIDPGEIRAAIDNAIPRVSPISHARYRRHFSPAEAEAFFLRVLLSLPEGATVMDMREALESPHG